MPLPYTDEEAIYTPLVSAIQQLEAKIDALIAAQDAPPTHSSLLTQEFFSNQDLDGGAGGGNSVYGHANGFQIDETDLNFPPALFAVHNNPLFGAPTITLTWQQYLDSL